MNDSNEILKALGFSEEYIKELKAFQNADSFDVEYISFENDVEEEVYSSNTAIVDGYIV